MFKEFLERTKNVFCLYGCEYELCFVEHGISVSKIYFFPGKDLPACVSDKELYRFYVRGKTGFYVLERKLTLYEWARCRLRLVVCVDSPEEINEQKMPMIRKSIARVVASGVSDIFIVTLANWGKRIRLNRVDASDDVFLDLCPFWERTKKKWSVGSCARLHSFID